MTDIQFGVLDNSFLARSVGTLGPKTPICLPHDAALKQALALLKQHKIGALIITDSAGKVSGIFSERDVILRVACEKLDPTTPMERLMTAKPKTVQMTTTIAHALQLISEQGYRHLPIIDDEGFPLGMISIKDLVDYISHSLTTDLLNFDEN